MNTLYSRRERSLGPVLLATAAALALAATTAHACPVCGSDTGRAVRALVFGPDFLMNLLSTALPAAATLAAVALFHYGPPRFLPPGLFRKGRPARPLPGRASR